MYSFRDSNWLWCIFCAVVIASAIGDWEVDRNIPRTHARVCFKNTRHKFRNELLIMRIIKIVYYQHSPEMHSLRVSDVCLSYSALHTTLQLMFHMSASCLNTAHSSMSHCHPKKNPKFLTCCVLSESWHNLILDSFHIIHWRWIHQQF
jgi:hypothetical protein